MNTLSKIALALIGFVAVVYTVGANYRHNVHTEIVIKAPPQVVWSHLVDFENYPSWHPSITKLSAELIAGAPLRGTGKKSGQDFVFTLLVVERESELRWEASDSWSL
ncbi:MAG: SRPBCC family protein [bacterium]